MKIKVSKLANAIPSLKFMMSQNIQAKISLKIAKFINCISDEMDIVEETRKAIFLKYSDGTKLLTENIEKYDKELKCLLEEEVEISLEPIPITDLGAIPIPVNHMMALDFMFKD